MPTETVVTRCGNCGAALQPAPGAALLTCAYCRQTTYLAPTLTATVAARPAVAVDDAPLHERLMAGPLGERVGHGVRRPGPQVPREQVFVMDRVMWPSDARASSTFGGSWSPSTRLGAPRVFPRCGDIGGAWAPGPARSNVEWVELSFPHAVPSAAVRVFETHRAGSTYAVVDVTDGRWELLWCDHPDVLDDASLLEVSLATPRVIRTLRVYLTNPGWAELDTVGLLSAAPLPEALRSRDQGASTLGAAAATVGSAVIWVAFAALVLAVVVVSAVFAMRAGGGETRTPPPPRPAAQVDGATLSVDTPDPSALHAAPLVWAAAVLDRSSEFSSSRNAAGDALGPPDVYPVHADVDGAWASRETDAGPEWITVRFAAPVTASAVLWVETLHPGAVVRVDDVSTPASTAVLWEGAAQTSPQSVVARVTLPSPRVISAVRLVLDTRRVSGWNEIDAIALAP